MELPPEIVITINKIIKHSEHLEYLTYANEQQIQQARYNEIQSKLPAINEQLNRIRELPKNNDLYETRKNELLKERLYFYHKVNRSAEDFLTGKVNEITQEDIDRLNNYIATLDSIEQEIINSNKQTQQIDQTQEPEIKTEQPTMKNDQVEISRLKEQIQQYDNQIALLLTSIQPYMQVPKINNEISKVIAKNNEINSSQIIDSLTDYQRVVEMKQQLVTYLQQADKVIKDKVVGLQQQEQEVGEQLIIQEQPQIQPTNQTPNDDFWAEFDALQQEQKPQEPLPDNFWAEFDNPQQMTRPEKNIMMMEHIQWNILPIKQIHH